MAAAGLSSGFNGPLMMVGFSLQLGGFLLLRTRNRRDATPEVAGMFAHGGDCRDRRESLN